VLLLPQDNAFEPGKVYDVHKNGNPTRVIRSRTYLFYFIFFFLFFCLGRGRGTIFFSLAFQLAIANGKINRFLCNNNKQNQFSGRTLELFGFSSDGKEAIFTVEECQERWR
jgi:hypothetical protein